MKKIASILNLNLFYNSYSIIYVINNNNYIIKIISKIHSNYLRISKITLYKHEISYVLFD